MHKFARHDDITPSGRLSPHSGIQLRRQFGPNLRLPRGVLTISVKGTAFILFYGIQRSILEYKEAFMEYKEAFIEYKEAFMEGYQGNFPLWARWRSKLIQ